MDFWHRPLRVIQTNLRKIDARTLDPVRLVAQVVEYGGNVMLVNAGGIVAWYPTRLSYQPVNEFLSGDFLDALLREAHRQGLRVLARLDVSKGHLQFHAQHPEWFQVTAEGKTRYEWGMPLTCFHGPYWQRYAFELVAEISARYAVDGFFFNRFHHDHCLCSACQEAFRAHTGLALPHQENWDDPAWRAFVRFRYQQMADYAGRLRAFIRERNPRAILAVDFRLTDDMPEHLCEAGWLGPRLADNVDLITVEAFNPLERPLPKYYLWAGEEVRMGRALQGDRPVCVILTYSGIFSSRRAAQPPAQLAYDLLQVAAHGGQPCVAFSGTFAQDDRKALPTIKAIYHYLRDHAGVYEHLSSPARVALVYSQSTMDFYGRGAARERCLAEYRGLYEALVEGHVQFGVLHDADLTRTSLKRYALVILPNVAVLTSQQAALLDAFVEAGGHLLATFETALYDDQGNLRKLPALCSLGRTIEGSLPCTGAYLRILDKSLFPALQETDLVPLRGTFLITGASGEGGPQVADLHLIPPVVHNTPEYAYWEEERDVPGLVLSSFGLGKVAYLPWEVGKLYHQLGGPEYKQLVLSLVRRFVSPLVITDAPGSVEVVLSYLKGDPEHALVHLLNATGLQSKPLTEIIPLRDISVWVSGAYVAARELWSGQDLELHGEGDGVQFSLSRLETFAAVELVGEGFRFVDDA